MNNQGATCCIVYHRLTRKTQRETDSILASNPYYTPTMHYSTFWLLESDKMIHYDSNTRKLTELIRTTADSSPAGEALTREYDGLIFGKNAKMQVLYYFNIAYQLNFAIDVIDKRDIIGNLNALADKIFLDILKLRTQGLNIPTLQLFSERTKVDKRVYFRNNIVEVRESNLRNLQTCKLFYVLLTFTSNYILFHLF